MSIKTANAHWNGTLPAGSGHLKTQSGVLDTDYTWKARAENGPGTNPEELIAAAHAGCFSMALAHILEASGEVPVSIDTTAEVKFEKQGDGFGITGITLKTKGKTQSGDQAKFKEAAEKAKAGCPVSKALASVPITLELQ